MVETGIDADDAYGLIKALDQLEPEEGRTTVSNVQRWREIVDFPIGDEDHLFALYAVMDEAQYHKAETAYEYGIRPRVYVEFQEIKADFDADGNGTFTQAEVWAAIDSLDGLSNQQRAVLWQLSNKSWKADKNPYDRSVGQRIVDEWG